MPLTLAHPAAVLPLRRLGLPMAALVLGSMVPDLPVLTGDWSLYGLSHSLLGLVTVNLVGALVLMALWDFLVRDALVDASPARIRDRLPARARIGRTGWVLAPLGAVLGSATHLVWDAFTHQQRWGVELIGWLQEQHGPFSGAAWAQYVSSLLGLGVVLAAMAARLRGPIVAAGRPRRLPAAILPSALAVAGIASLAIFVSRGGDARSGALHAAAFDAAVVGILGLLAVTLLVTVAWAAASRRGPRA